MVEHCPDVLMQPFPAKEPMTLNPATIQQLRTQFPALSRRVTDRPAIFFDGPAGTQVPQRVIDAISSYLSTCNANRHGSFATSIEGDQRLDQAHQAVAEFLGADDQECVIFGPNMTTLTQSLARSLTKTWKPGDEILLSGLEHDANFTPWRQAAEDAGAQVQVVDIHHQDCTLDLDDFKRKLNENTRLVAVGCASNASGSINPVSEICQMTRQVGALSFLDAVHFAPHDRIDVQRLGCDFLTCSAYKFFGPHIGVLWGRRELLESLQPYKLRPAPNQLPERWMTGTQNHECILGTAAAIEYLADIGRTATGVSDSPRPEALTTAFAGIRAYERELCDRLLDGLAELDGYRVWGITQASDRGWRLPTVSITHATRKPIELAKLLAAAGIFVWHGNYYALPLTERIGVEPDGMARIGLVHYNTPEEVDYLLHQLQQLG